MKISALSSKTLIALLVLGFFGFVSPLIGGGDDCAMKLAADASENIYVTGKTTNNGAFDFATLKYNSNGVQQWKALYNGPGNGNDIANAVVVDSCGNVYVTGSSIGLGSGLDYATVKYNANGLQQWIARYNGSGNGDDIAYGIAIDPSGNVYVTGSSTGLGSGLDYATVKYNSNGVQQWVIRYNGTANGDDIAYAIAVDTSGNVHITGTSLGNSQSWDFLTVKYNCNGSRIWTHRWMGYGNGSNVAKAIGIDPCGNVIITGSSLATGAGLNYMTIKLNSNGALLWSAGYNGPGNGDDKATALVIDCYGNIYITGSSTGLGSGLDYATIKYNPGGSVLWRQRYNGPGNGDDQAMALAVDGSGKVYVTGSSTGLGSGLDYATMKYNANGTWLWSARYNGPANGDDKTVGISVNNVSGNVYVTGSSVGLGTLFDYATVKYNPNSIQQWVSRFDGP